MACGIGISQPRADVRHNTGDVLGSTHENGQMEGRNDAINLRKSFKDNQWSWADRLISQSQDLGRENVWDFESKGVMSHNAFNNTHQLWYCQFHTFKTIKITGYMYIGLSLTHF